MILVYILISIAGAWLTYQLIKKPQITPTRASSFISLVGVSILFIINQMYQIPFEYLSALFFGSSFVGMCSHKVISEFSIILGAIFFALLYVYLVPVLGGLGGALGFSAFVSVVLSSLSYKFISSFKKA